MIYNTPIKFLIKGAIGRKNDAWYFDKLLWKINKNCNKEYELYKRLLPFINSESVNESFLPPEGFSNNEFYNDGITLRNASLMENFNKFICHKLKILIQIPPQNISPGGYSLFSNLADGMEYMGINVIRFWDNLSQDMLINSQLLMTSSSSLYLKHLPAIKLNESRNNGLKIIATCDQGSLNLLSSNNGISGWKLNMFDGFYHFNSHIQIESNAKDLLYKLDKTIYSLPFSANPIIHYPARWKSNKFNYIFLGSINYSKAKRYYDFFNPLTNKFNGLIAGPGWPWCKGFEMNLFNDKYTYSLSKVGLNLHLQSQITGALPQLNERAYLLPACGVFQLMDNPYVLKSVYQNQVFGKSTNEPKEYLDILSDVLNDKFDTSPIVYESMKNVFQNHTVFHRITNFLIQLKII